MSQVATDSPSRSTEPKEQSICPICHKRKNSKRRRLYGFRVCRRCWASFINLRQAAFIVDIILIWLLLIALTRAVVYIAGSSPFPTDALENIRMVLSVVLFVMKDSVSGMSPGKYLSGVQVVDFATREPTGVAASIKRNLVFAIPLINLPFFLIGAFQMSDGPRVGDGWARTLVIWRKYARKLPFDPSGIYCLVCDYNLTGNVLGICPECGTPVPEHTRERLIRME